jgi:hypothetical protein
VFVFRLDGKATRRKLAADGRPLVWSRDAQWLLVQEGDTACALRAAGGERRCWDGYRAIALGPDSRHALLGKPPERGDGVDLYIAALGGTRPAAPRLLVKGAAGAATWLP